MFFGETREKFQEKYIHTPSLLNFNKIRDGLCGGSFYIQPDQNSARFKESPREKRQKKMYIYNKSKRISPNLILNSFI